MQFLLLTVAFLVYLPLVTSNIVSGMGYKNYTELIVGDPESRVIITASHGGYLEPPDIPDRTDGCRPQNECLYGSVCVGEDTSTKCKVGTFRDNYTKELALLLRDELSSLTGYNPYVVINHLHRKKLDANRKLAEAAQGNADASKAYADFHNFTQSARLHMDKGVVFDIHGQTHTEDWTELGYRITKKRLNSPQSGKLVPKYSSIRSLADTVIAWINPISFEDLVRGNSSLGAMLQNRGYNTTPSPANPKPGNNYFIGGYITKNYGSQYGGQVDAVQVECPVSVRGASTSPAFAGKLAEAIKQFVEKYYGSTQQ